MCGTSVFCMERWCLGTVEAWKGKHKSVGPKAMSLCNPGTPTVRWEPETGAEARGALPVQGGRWEPTPGSCPPTCKCVSQCVCLCVCLCTRIVSKGNMQIVKGDHSSLEKGSEMLLLVKNCWSLDYGFCNGKQ